MQRVWQDQHPPCLPPLLAPPPPPSPCVTFRRAVSLRGPGQSPVLPFACCVGLLLSVGRCGRCSCWCHFRVRGAHKLVCRGCAGCGSMCRLRVSGVQWLVYWGCAGCCRGRLTVFAPPPPPILPFSMPDSVANGSGARHWLWACLGSTPNPVDLVEWAFHLRRGGGVRGGPLPLRGAHVLHKGGGCAPRARRCPPRGWQQGCDQPTVHGTVNIIQRREICVWEGRWVGQEWVHKRGT